MATYTLTVNPDVWIDDACTAVITSSKSDTNNSEGTESVTVLLSMSSSAEGDENPYSQFDTELTLDGWIDNQITFSFRDFARSAYNYGMDYITMQIVAEEGEEEGEEEKKTIYLHGGIRPHETIYPLTEYRVIDADDTQPVYFVGKGLTLYGTAENTCPPPGNKKEETSEVRAQKKRDSGGR